MTTTLTTIVFEVDTEFGKFRDSLDFPSNEPLPDSAVIESMKLERVTRWVEDMRASRGMV